MQRYASVELRRRVDAAVGQHYDSAFLRLDLLVAGRQSRCRCSECRAAFERRLGAILASLPELPELPSVRS